jgi:hypothetical protein
VPSFENEFFHQANSMTTNDLRIEKLKSSQNLRIEFCENSIHSDKILLFISATIVPSLNTSETAAARCGRHSGRVARRP